MPPRRWWVQPGRHHGTGSRSSLPGAGQPRAGLQRSLCQPAGAALPQTTVHLFHGKADPVIPYVHSVQAAEHLIALGGDVTAEIEPFVGHQLHEDLLEKAVEYLQSHIPKHVWDEALSATPPQGSIKPHEITASLRLAVLLQKNSQVISTNKGSRMLTDHSI
jgi:hypothetical protein